MLRSQPGACATPAADRRAVPSELQVALSCLAHPWSLAALAILGLNDHLWKGAGPGWLTGKLSDFAGLFFFPFLVSALLAVVAGRRRSTGATAFAVVALWFATAKTLVPVHAATVALAAFLFGPVEVVRDPTDLIALVALLPAWRLRRRIASEAPSSLTRLVQTPALFAALLLTSATSRPEHASVEGLVEHEGGVYAVIENQYPSENYRSVDGIHWLYSSSLPPAMIEGHEPRTELTTTEPSPESYRLSGQKVLRLDRGRWQVAWQIPEGRTDFMRTYRERYWQARDIAALPGGGVVVALGSQGVVTRRPDGSWTRVGVGEARPTPIEAELAEIPWRLVDAHWLSIAMAIASVWVLSSLLLWFVAPPAAFPSAGTHRPRAGFVARLRARASSTWARTEWRPKLASPLLVSLVFLAPLAIGSWFPIRPGDFGLVIFVLPPLLIVVLAMLTGWRRFRGLDPDTRVSVSAWRLAVGAASGGLAAAAVLTCWNLGWIASLYTANVLITSAVVVAAAATAHTARAEPAAAESGRTASR